MTEKNVGFTPQRPFFINQFVNTVYGIILGTGVVNSASQVKKWCPSENVHDASILLALFSVISLIFIVVVVCVYWWDWVANVGYRAKNTGLEFTIDISILLSLECLFFSFEYPPVFSGMFFLLSILNLFWVYNFRFEEFRTMAKNDNTISWSDFLKRNERAKSHIRRRWYGVLLFFTIFILAVMGDVYHIYPQSFGHLDRWIILLLLVISGLVNRHFLYRDRFKKGDEEPSES